MTIRDDRQSMYYPCRWKNLYVHRMRNQSSDIIRILIKRMPILQNIAGWILIWTPLRMILAVLIQKVWIQHPELLIIIHRLIQTKPEHRHLFPMEKNSRSHKLNTRPIIPVEFAGKVVLDRITN